MSDKAIFLDCDNTLIEDVGYINHPDQVKLLDGAAEALIEFGAMGYKLIVVSNQSSVARGIVTEEVLDEIHERLKQLLAENGAHLDRIYYCPYHPEAVVAKYRKESDWRKPNPGMLLAAADEMDIDLEQSWMIGNSGRDVEAGLSASCKTILMDNPSHDKQPEPGEPNPDYKAVNTKEAVNIIKKHHRSSDRAAAQIQSAPTDETQPVLQAEEQPSQPVLQVEEQPFQPEPVEPETATAGQNIAGERLEQLLSGILEQLKGIQRADMFSEFSIMRLIAGVVQIIVLFCLLISIWFLMSPAQRDNSALIALGFAMVLQMMSLTFYIMQGRK